MAKQNISLAVDAVVFGYQENQIFLLLIKQKFGPYRNHWCLPGGFVKNEEPLKVAVKRELKEETGIQVNYLEQLCTFGDQIDRDPRGRVVSTAYFALVNPSKFKLKADTDAAEVEWFPIASIPKLGFDHKKIVKVALERLQAKIKYHPIGLNLLDKKFLFSDLEKIYTSILDKAIDRRNFHKKFMQFDLLEDTGEKRKVGKGRPATVFTFKKSKYKQLLKEGFHFEL